MTPPVLETERLALRGAEARDAEGYIAFMASERARHVGGPFDRIEAWRWFATVIGHWTLRGYGEWAVTLKGEDRCVGLIGCWRPEGWPEPELAWSVWPEAEGRGIAHEAALAARRCAYKRFGWTTAVSYVDPDNRRSRRLAERLGAVEDPDAERIDPGDLVYRHPAPEAFQ